MAWRVVLTNSSYTPIAEIDNISEFKHVAALSKFSQVSFTVPYTHRWALALATGGFIKAYRGTTLKHFGPIVTTEEQGDNNSGSVAVTSMDVGWMLTKRLTGKSATGTLFTSATDRALIAKSLIDTINTEYETGLSTANYNGLGFAAGSGITYTAGPYRPMSEVLSELGAALDGFDWLVRPIEPASGKIGVLQARPIIGATQANSVFEYGTGRSNIANYGFTWTRDVQANTMYHQNSAASTGAVLTSGPDATSQTAWGKMEDIIRNDISDATMRQKLIDEHVAVRQNPRRLIRFTPHIDASASHVPQPYVEYDLGDTVTARIARAGIVRFAGAVRVYGISCSMDEAGFERVELILEDQS